MREFDIIVYGATGFTGRLVAEYLAGRDPDGLRWAMAGRSLTKLQEVRDAIGAPADTPLLTANADDPAALRAMAARAAVVISTVDYQLYGSDLVAACAATGTAYVDLCGEPAWMRHMIDAHHEVAKASGARIVFSCGFDSIPFDLGVWTLEQAAVSAVRRAGAAGEGAGALDEGNLLRRHLRQRQGDDDGGGARSVDPEAAGRSVRADPRLRGAGAARVAARI